MNERERLQQAEEALDRPPRVPLSVRVEDVLVLLAAPGLLVCFLLRDRPAGQIGLWVLLGLMLGVFIRRTIRLRRAMKGK